MATRADESEREVGIVKVDDRVDDTAPQVEAKPATPPAPPRVPPDAPPRTPMGPSFGERVGRFFRFLLRLIFLLIALAIIGLALYILLPELYQHYVRPVEQNTAEVRELRSWQEQTEQELADLQTRLESLETLQNQHAGSLAELDQRMSDIETEITARRESLAALERLQSELEEQNQAVSAELERQINLLKGMELLSRARLSMYQSNFGLARQDVQIARDILATLQPDAPESLAEELEAVLLRLDLTLSNLPNFPVAASDDLDIAWQILLSGFPEVTPTVSATPIPATTVSPGPTANATFTSTPKATAQPTATP